MNVKIKFASGRAAKEQRLKKEQFVSANKELQSNLMRTSSVPLLKPLNILFLQLKKFIWPCYAA